MCWGSSRFICHSGDLVFCFRHSTDFCMWSRNSVSLFVLLKVMKLRDANVNPGLYCVFHFVFNTLRTGDTDLRFYITTVQDG